MDDEAVSPLQQLADDRLEGGLRELVEQLRAEDLGWRPVAEMVSIKAQISVGYETVRGWAERGRWNVDKPSDRAAAS